MFKLTAHSRVSAIACFSILLASLGNAEQVRPGANPDYGTSKLPPAGAALIDPSSPQNRIKGAVPGAPVHIGPGQGSRSQGVPGADILRLETMQNLRSASQVSQAISSQVSDPVLRGRIEGLVADAAKRAGVDFAKSSPSEIAAFTSLLQYNLKDNDGAAITSLLDDGDVALLNSLKVNPAEVKAELIETVPENSPDFKKAYAKALVEAKKGSETAHANFAAYANSGEALADGFSISRAGGKLTIVKGGAKDGKITEAERQDLAQYLEQEFGVKVSPDSKKLMLFAGLLHSVESGKMDKAAAKDIVIACKE